MHVWASDTRWARRNGTGEEAHEVHDEQPRDCQGTPQNMPGGHIHIPLLGGRAAAAAIYPKELCEAIVRGLVKQKKLHDNGTVTLGSIARVEKMTTEDLKNFEQDGFHEKTGTPTMHGIREKEPQVDNDWMNWMTDHAEEYGAEDDVTGAVLNPKEVAKARRTDIEFSAGSAHTGR